MSVIPDASTSSLRPFLFAAVEPGATVVTDGWGAYPGACHDWFGHEPHPVAGSGSPAHELLPAVHRGAFLCKRWLLGTHQGGMQPEHMQAYLDEALALYRQAARRRARPAVLPAYAVRRRRTPTDVPRDGRQDPTQGHQAGRSPRRTVPAQQPRSALGRPALAGNYGARVGLAGPPDPGQ
jgi:hypothetical protein